MHLSTSLFIYHSYVYRMSGPQRELQADLLALQQQHWLNNHTRALFLEFSVYNAQVCVLILIRIHVVIKPVIR